MEFIDQNQFDQCRCTKPDRKEFSKIAIATAIGFGIMVMFLLISIFNHNLISDVAVINVLRLCVSGLHWVLCQADPHSHQQHHCGRLEDAAQENMN